MKLIEDNYMNIQRVQELSQIIGVSSCYLNQKFKHHQLKGAKKLLVYMKIRHALWLMEDHRFSLKEIASICGFESYKYLIRWTKSAIHLSPGDIRQIVASEGACNFWKYRGPSPYLM